MTTTHPPTYTYTCIGSVRMECGVVHRSYDVAARHVEEDRRVCIAIGGGAYSDRRIYQIDEDGHRVGVHYDEDGYPIF